VFFAALAAAAPVVALAIVQAPPARQL